MLRMHILEKCEEFLFRMRNARLLPRLLPLASRNTVQSSIVPYDWKSERMFGSSRFFETIPTNSFRSKLSQTCISIVIMKFHFYHFDFLYQQVSFVWDDDFHSKCVSYEEHFAHLMLIFANKT